MMLWSSIKEIINHATNSVSFGRDLNGDPHLYKMHAIHISINFNSNDDNLDKGIHDLTEVTAFYGIYFDVSQNTVSFKANCTC